MGTRAAYPISPATAFDGGFFLLLQASNSLRMSGALYRRASLAVVLTLTEVLMLKSVICVLTFLFVAGSSLAYAQESPPPIPSQANFKALTDARVGIVKAALQLTAEQEKLWPPVEEAIRARAQARYDRMVAVAGKLGQGREVDPVELMRGRADALAKRAANLKQLADAWAPLYQTLNSDQKERMRLLARHVLRELRDGVDTRPMEMYDEDECDKD